MRQPTGDNTLAGYVRQSSADIIPTATVRAAPINAEYNKLRDAFAISSGHKHDGSTGEGGYIPLIGDVDALNKVVIDTSNNRVGVFVEVSSAAVEQVRFQDGVILPVTTNDIDLGSSSAKFKDLHLQGTATIATVDINAGNIDGTIIGASSPTTATFTSATLNNNLTVTGTSTLVGTTTITSVDLNSGAIDNAVIGSATPVAGTFTTLNANTSLVAATADINGGTLDGATVGASVPSTGAFTTLTASGTSTLTTVDINGGNIDGTVIGASATAAGSFTTLSTSGQATLATADINGGSIDGSTIGASSASTGAFTTLTSSGGITGNVTGNLTGNVTGNVTGDVTGNVTGNLTGNVTAGSGTSTFTNVTIDGTLNMNAGTSATIQNLTAPTNDLDAATKKYVDDEISTLIGDAGAGLDTLGELADALNDDDDFSTTVTNSIATKLPKAGGTMTGAIAMSTNKITGAGDPTSAQDVATKAYTDAQRDTRVAKTGDTMSGALAMGNNKITGLATPTAGTDVTNKTYVDGILGSATVAATSATNAATSETNAATSATNAATSETNAATSATNAAASYDNFDDRYLGAKSSAPTVDNDGDALITGALYFNSTTNIMNVYGSGGWQSAGSAVNGTSERNTYTATAGQTVFAATYDTGYIDVYLNGVKLLAGTDFTATNGTSITLASGASVNDVVDIVAYGTFVLADHYTRTASDARYVEVAGDTMTGNLNVTGTVTSDGLTVDGEATFGTATGVFPDEAILVRGNNGTSGYINGLGVGSSNAQFRIFADDTNNTAGSIKFDIRNRDRLLIEDNGDISFYEDTGTTAKFFWDSSAESLGIGTSSPAENLHISSSSGSARIRMTSADGSDNMIVFGDASDSATGAIKFDHSNNALSFNGYNNTERMRINSSGNVGIGLSTNIASKLHVNSELSLGPDNNNRMIVGSTSGGVGSIGTIENGTASFSTMTFKGGNVGIGTTSPDTELNIGFSGADDTNTIRVEGSNGASERYAFDIEADGENAKTNFKIGVGGGSTTTCMTLDSSGNVLVGKTTLEYSSNTGHVLRNDGLISAVRSGGNVVNLNRLSNDGEIIQLNKDGTRIGSIGTNGSTLYIGSTEGADAHLGFGNQIIRPVTSSGASRDNAIDLGYNGMRFRDAYLSGGVYLGGTGAANKLEDYEEGTWTPTVGTGTMTSNFAHYTKVGNQVTISCVVYSFSDRSSTNGVGIQNLPFTSSSTARSTGSVMIRNSDNTTITASYITSSSNTVEFYGVTTGFWDQLKHNDLNSTDSELYFNITYRTDA